MQTQTSLQRTSPITRVHQEPKNASAPVTGKPFSIRSGFKALSFKHAMFDGLMDPLVMVDHYTMTEPTFGAHPHAGMSAVTVLFEDSIGSFNNRDSLGNDIDLQPGDLYWLKAGSGAVHDEKPVPGAAAHGLQMFVNLPARMKHDAPQTLHVKASEMPVIRTHVAKVRLVLGESNGLRGASSPALPMTILDAMIDAGGHFDHDVAPGHSQWLCVIDGRIEVTTGEYDIAIAAGEAVAIGADQETASLSIRTDTDSHVVVVTGEPIAEPFVQRGPFVMNNKAEIAQVEAAFRAGHLGRVSE